MERKEKSIKVKLGLSLTYFTLRGSSGSSSEEVMLLLWTMRLWVDKGQTTTLGSRPRAMEEGHKRGSRSGEITEQSTRSPMRKRYFHPRDP